MRKTEASAIRLNALWCGLGYLAKKRGNRDIVGDGTSTKVAVDIVGTVGRAKVAETIVGSLEIGDPQEKSSSSAAPAADVVALLLPEIGDPDRQAAVMAKIANHIETHERLPEPDPAAAVRAEAWLKRLRSSKTETQRGNLVFSLKSAAAVLFLAVSLLFTGCVPEPAPLVTPNPPPAAEVPVVDLPRLLREWNWPDERGSGSCVHASSIYHFRWQNQLPLAEWWRKNHAGGETATSILAYWRAAGIKYHATEEGDPAFLDWATRTRRGAIIWFFPSHCVHFCGFSNVDGRSYALLCDNNRIEKYIRVPREEFLRRWREYGGFAATALFQPAPPLPWQAYRLADSQNEE